MTCDACLTGEHSSCTDPLDDRQTPDTGHWTVVHCCCATPEDAVAYQISLYEGYA